MSTNYIIIDTAGTQEISKEVEELFIGGEILLLGKYKQMFFDVAPILFDFSSEQQKFIKDVLWGNGLSIFIYAKTDKYQVIKTLSENTEIVTDDDEVMFFRYYDPRVLRVFLPTCNKEQLKEFFGSIEYFLCEADDPQFGLAFSVDKNYNLITHRLSKERFFEFLLTKDTQLIISGTSTFTEHRNPPNKDKKDKPSGKNKFSIFD